MSCSTMNMKVKPNRRGDAIFDVGMNPGFEPATASIPLRADFMVQQHGKMKWHTLVLGYDNA